jgi:hypothetical protein
MEREEQRSQDRARVVIVSRRARGRRTGAGDGDASSATLSLVPRWSSGRAVEAAAEALREVERRPGSPR